MVNLSLICPCYNSGDFLPSLLSSYDKLDKSEGVELILVVDPSNDRSEDVIKEAMQKDPTIKSFFNKERLGLMSSRLLGIEHAQGEYIGFVDGDDSLEPNFATEMLNAIKENDADIVDCSFFLDKGDHESAYHFHMGNKALDRKHAIKALLNDIGIRGYLWSKVFKVSLFNDKQLIIFNNHGFEDLPFVFSLFDKANKVVSLNKPLYHYYVETHESLTHDNSKRAAHHVESYLSLKAYAELKGDKELIQLVSKAYPRMKGMLFYDLCLSKGLDKEAKKSLKKDLKLIKSKTPLDLSLPKYQGIKDALSFAS